MSSGPPAEAGILLLEEGIFGLSFLCLVRLWQLTSSFRFYEIRSPELIPGH